MLRLLALLLLVGLAGGGYYYWKNDTGARPPRSLEEAQQQLEDVALTGAVKTALSLHKNLKSYEIAVSTESGIVTLRGELPSGELEAAAERVAAAVPDVRQVVNHLRLNEALAAASQSSAEDRTIGERLDDEALAVRVRMAFSLNKTLKQARIEVESRKKEVRLSGTVNDEQRRLAVLTASEVSGVGKVSNQLSVATPAGKGGEERLAAVDRAIRGNANLQGAAIKVRLDGTRIVLEGRVKTGAERDLAGLLARDAAGQAIDNGLEIRR